MQIVLQPPSRAPPSSSELPAQVMVQTPASASLETHVPAQPASASLPPKVEHEERQICPLLQSVSLWHVVPLQETGTAP